jgi:hypothetical protein
MSKNININLYKSDETPLSCHLTSLTLCGDKRNLEKKNKLLDNLQSNIDNSTKLQYLSVLTIRSASLVGNTKLIGVGVMGGGRSFEVIDIYIYYYSIYLIIIINPYY